MASRILIVDDTETMRLYEHMLLSGQGYDLDMASDGVEAIEKIAQRKPDLVLLDIMMPRMNGIECCRQIKAKEDTKDIKVVMVTTKSEYEKVKEAFAAGCDDYVTKPINRVELLAKMKELLKFAELRQLLKS
ncbi:MAG: response regulator [Myxococcota bacterium]|jgi:CheY-like chemotaxis protein|nr:response regulator [Myxococcota bacterium]